jgi:hypothetical protein
MKCPDAVCCAVEDMDDHDRELAYKVTDKFIEYKEYLTVEFDTEKQTATVLPI